MLGIHEPIVEVQRKALGSDSHACLRHSVLMSMQQHATSLCFSALCLGSIGNGFLNMTETGLRREVGHAWIYVLGTGRVPRGKLGLDLQGTISLSAISKPRQVQ